MTPRHFAWQAWHLVTSTCVSRGRRGTISHPPSFCVAGVALMALGGALGLRDAYVTSTLVSQTISHTSLSHTICLNVLSHTIFHTIFVNNSLTHISVTHHPPASRFTPSSSHTLRHRPSFTHNFVAHRLSHTIFHKSLWLKQKRMEQKTHVYLYSCVSGLFWHVCFSGLFSSSRSDWSSKPFGHQIHVAFAGMFT